MISVVLCFAPVTDSPVLVVYSLTSRPVSYPDWLETNVECRLLDMQIWWCLTSFAVGDRTGCHGLASLFRYCKTGSTFFGELHWLGYQWHYCVRSLSLMRRLPDIFAVHPHLPIQETKWQLTWLWHVWYFIFHLAKSIIIIKKISCKHTSIIPIQLYR